MARLARSRGSCHCLCPTRDVPSPRRCQIVARMRRSGGTGCRRSPPQIDRALLGPRCRALGSLPPSPPLPSPAMLCPLHGCVFRIPNFSRSAQYMYSVFPFLAGRIPVVYSVFPFLAGRILVSGSFRQANFGGFEAKSTKNCALRAAKPAEGYRLHDLIYFRPLHFRKPIFDRYT